MPFFNCYRPHFMVWSLLVAGITLTPYELSMARSRNLVDSTNYCVMIGWLSFIRTPLRLQLKGMLRLNDFLPLSTNFRKLLNHQMECFTNLLLERPSMKGTWITVEVFLCFHDIDIPLVRLYIVFGVCMSFNRFP